MIRNLSDILVLSDMDGTLLAPDKSLPPGNLETIRLFTALGGRFSIATGRVAISAAPYAEELGCVSTSITCGGCVLYDYQNNVIKSSTCLPAPVARKALGEIMRLFPKLGVVIMADDGNTYYLTTSPQTYKLQYDENIPMFLRSVENIPQNWNKILFAGTPDLLGDLEDFVSTKDYPGVYFVASDTVYFEMMPAGISKGSAIPQLCNLLKVPIENTIAIGDYFNDIDMMRMAGHSVAMANAPEEIRALADETTGACYESGVGQFLYRLIKKYG